VRPKKSTCGRLLKSCADLTEAERHDLAEVLSYWSHTEEHARRIVSELPSRPTAIDIRRLAARVRPPMSSRRPQPGCPYCFGSGFAVKIGVHGYTGAQPCSCLAQQPELLLAECSQEKENSGW
jgi:hypothetical protein